MKNRKLILIVSLVLAMTMSLGGTLAYLTDTDSDVNTMVLGNVKIEQHEYERKDVNGDGKFDSNDATDITEGDETYNSYLLQDFTQDKMLLPATELKPDGTPDNWGAGGYDSIPVRMSQVGSAGGLSPFKSPLAVDKFVTVENTGNTNAFVRTYIAFEAGSKTYEEVYNLIGSSYHANSWSWTDLGIVNINGNNYSVSELVYKGVDVRHTNGILPAGETTYPSLGQVYLDSTADNDDVADLDGNKNNKYDIIVLSQAVQADGFADATTALTAGFGVATATSKEDANKTNVQVWLEAASTQLPKVHNVTDAAGLIAAAKEGGVIDLTGKTITFDGNRGEYITAPAEGSVKIIGGTIAGYKGDGELRMAANIKQGNVIFENVTFKIDEETSGWAINVNINGTANVTFRNCTFTGIGCPIYQSGANTVVTIEDCTFEGEPIQAEIRSGDYQLGQDLIIKNCDFGTIPDVLHICDHDKNPSSEEIAQYLKDNGNTFTGTCKQTCN